MYVVSENISVTKAAGNDALQMIFIFSIFQFFWWIKYFRRIYPLFVGDQLFSSKY